MNIQQAVKKAVKVDGYITGGFAGNLNNLLFVKPTDSQNCCILYANKDRSCRGWQPCASDLLSDDWEVLTEEDFLFLSTKSNLF